MPESPTVELRHLQPGDEAFLARVYASTREAEMAIVPWTDEQKAAFVAMQFEAQTSHYRATMPEAEWHVVLVDERLGFEPVRDEGFYRLMEWRPRRVWRNE